MNSVKLMIEEHVYIVRMLKVVRAACYGVLKGKDINYDDFNEMIDFIRTYADAHHHGKEEKFLFKEMQQNLGKLGETLITHGMMVEHDYGRMYISDLSDALRKVKDGDEEKKLDVIASAISYTNLLHKHIAKEDTAVYLFGEKNLPKEIVDEINKKTEEFENKANEKGVQDHYINLLKNLEAKYIA